MALFLPLLGLVLAFALILPLLRSDSLLHILDHPNERSLHQHPVPRSGGLAVIFSVLTLWLLQAWLGEAPPAGLGYISLGVIMLALVGLWDDFGHLVIGLRLLAHFGAALLLGLAGLLVERLPVPGVDLIFSYGWSWLFTLLFVVWMVNLYNFMDGMDGLAGAMGVVGFGGLALFGALAGDLAFVSLNLAVVAAVLGFLAWNLPPARIFLGDAGSSVLGFLAAALALLGEARGVLPLWVALMLFSPFIFDATYSLLRRLVRGERFWLPHRQHLYQRLVASGWGQGTTLALAAMVMLAAALGAFAAQLLGDLAKGWILPLLLLFYGGITLWVGQREGRSSRV